MFRTRFSSTIHLIAIIAGLHAIAPGNLEATVRDVDHTAENTLGGALIVSNTAFAAYFAHGLATNRHAPALAYLGISLGVGSMALAATDVTSFTQTVFTAGLVATALGMRHLLIEPAEREVPFEHSFLPGSSMEPYLVSTADGHTVGLHFRSTF